jgi:hypothetical protein
VGNTALMKQKRAEQVRVPQVKRKDLTGNASCAVGEVCSNPLIRKRKKLLQRPASLEIASIDFCV